MASRRTITQRPDDNCIPCCTTSSSSGRSYRTMYQTTNIQYSIPQYRTTLQNHTHTLSDKYSVLKYRTIYILSTQIQNHIHIKYSNTERHYRITLHTEPHTCTCKELVYVKGVCYCIVITVVLLCRVTVLLLYRCPEARNLALSQQLSYHC